ncbi:MAG: hypothetical protein GY811_07665 [Myxococcales bacterium]|nr:hypothetical protein [Myxococcales bacterium]
MAKKKSARKAARRWTALEAGHILDEIEALELSDSEFARKRDLKIGRIPWWRQQLGRQRRGRGSAQRTALAKRGEQHAGFVEIDSVGQAPAETRIEVRLRNGRSVLLPFGTPADQLELMLNVIEGRSC